MTEVLSGEARWTSTMFSDKAPNACFLCKKRFQHLDSISIELGVGRWDKDTKTVEISGAPVLRHTDCASLWAQLIASLLRQDHDAFVHLAGQLTADHVRAADAYRVASQREGITAHEEEPPQGAVS